MSWHFSQKLEDDMGFGKEVKDYFCTLCVKKTPPTLLCKCELCKGYFCNDCGKYIDVSERTKVAICKLCYTKCEVREWIGDFKILKELFNGFRRF